MNYRLIAGIAIVSGSLLGAAGLSVANDVHHPDCADYTDIPPGVGTPVDGDVYVKAGNDHYNVGYHPAGYVAGPQNGHDVSHVDVCEVYMPTTTQGATTSTSSSTSSTTSSTSSTTTTSSGPTTSSSTTTEPSTSSSVVISTTTSPEQSSTTTTTVRPPTSTTQPPPSSTDPIVTTTTTVLASLSLTAETSCVDDTPFLFVITSDVPNLDGADAFVSITDQDGAVVYTETLTFISGAVYTFDFPLGAATATVSFDVNGLSASVTASALDPDCGPDEPPSETDPPSTEPPSTEPPVDTEPPVEAPPTTVVVQLLPATR
jgi:hypothetical protein